MDEVTTEAPVEETPNTDQPEAAQAESTAEVEAFSDLNPQEAPEGDITQEWLQERYKQMQADYTRKTQGISQTAQERQEELQFLESLRSDRDTQQAVLEQLQELLAESEDDTDDDDAPEESDLARQVAELREAEEQRTAQALTKSIVSHIEQLAKDAELELEEDDLRDIFNRATAGDDVNNDATSKAFQGWHERQKAQHAKWQAAYLKSKQAPQQVPAGQSATETPDLSNADERIKRMAAILEAGSQ